MSDRFAARAVADRAALHGIGLTIARNDDPGRAADRAAARRSEAVAVAQTDNYAAALDSSVAPVADSFSVAAIRNSAGAGIDSCVARNNCVLAGAGILVRDDWTSVVGVPFDA
jgi:hypothetical protein